MKVAESEGTPLFPAGTYPAACCGVIDLGTQEGQYGPRRKVLLMWELLDERIEYEKDGEKRSFMKTVTREFGASLGGGGKHSDLRKLLDAWRGRPFTAEELKGFDLKNVLGANGVLTIVHNASQDGSKVYANVASVGAPMRGQAKRKPQTPMVHFSFDNMPANEIVWPAEPIPEWIRKKIMASAEYAKHDAPHDDGYRAPLDDSDIPF